MRTEGKVGTFGFARGMGNTVSIKEGVGNEIFAPKISYLIVIMVKFYCCDSLSFNYNETKITTLC